MNVFPATTGTHSVLNENDQRVFSQFLDNFFIETVVPPPITYLEHPQQKGRELLTEEEKRNNHIASEQKRRGMIRTGFKDLTDIVPSLKNINNSKSTVLFKAADYIKYLERRNKGLRDKIKHLEFRINP